MDKLAVLGMQDSLSLEAAASGEGCSRVNSTKQVHNAKERLRRMNLSASYTALRYLLPNSKRSKKRWSAPKILEKALKYIPELVSELKKLTLEKESRALSNKETDNRNKGGATDTSITVIHVSNGALALQICVKSAMPGIISGLMCTAEDKGMSIVSFSSVEISDDRVCCHLQVEINADRMGIDYLANIKDELPSWLKY